MYRITRSSAAAVLALGLLGRLQAQPSDAIHLVERSDWSRYVDGRYLGHAYRESRVDLLPGRGVGSGQAGAWAGEYYVLEETLRDARAEARRVDESGRSEVVIGDLGAIDEDPASPLPSLRGLLDLSRASLRRGFPERAPAPASSSKVADLLPLGASFVAPGLRLLDLGGRKLRLPFLAEYRVTSTGNYLDRPALLIKAKFATRLPSPPGKLTAASGSHDLDIWLDLETGLPLLVRDRFDETFAFDDGSKERRAGSTLQFWKGGDSIGRGALLASMDKSVSAEGKSTPGAATGPAATGVAQPAPNPAGSASPGSAAGAEPAGADDIRSAGATPVVGGAPLEPEPTPELAATLKNAGIEISEAEAGLLLRVFDLRFAADSDKLLPSEKPRLDVLARALAAAPAGRNFLVEGHAAATGKPQGELELSLARAKRIVDELVARGLSAGRFIYRGLGSTMPIASNEDEAGKSRNRRVEVTILD